MARRVMTGIALPSRESDETRRHVEIVVIHSGTKVTLKALRAASALARDLGANIRLLVPHIVPYPLALDESPLPAQYAGKRCRTLVEGLAIPTLIDLRICRDAQETIISALPPRAIVVMARRNVWKWSWEPALARKLRRLGHHVVVPGS